MAATCPSCFCSQPDGLLCWQCTQAVETMLTAAPYLVDQLDIAASKQAKISVGGKAGKGTAHLKEPVNWGAATARDELLIELALWGGDIDAIRKHPKAAEIVAGIGRAMKNGYQAIDRAADRQYLGTCGYSEDGATCHAELWVRHGAHQARCSQCETVHDVFDRRAAMLGMAADMLVNVREAASYIGSYGNLLVSESTIRSYLSKGLIGYHGKIDGTGVFRLGDLLVLIAEHAERKGGRPLRSASA